MKALKNIWNFINDWHYRHEVIEAYWNWKTKIGLVVLVIASIMFALFVYRAPQLWDCMGEQWEVGRETKYGFIFDTCVIDSGKRDADGGVIWVKTKRDIAIGNEL